MAELLIPLALIFVVSATLLVVAKRFGIPSIPVYIGIDALVFDAIVLAAAVTMITSTLTRQYDERLFEWIAGRRPFKSTHEKVREQSSVDPDLADHIVIIGYGTLGRHIAQTCDRLGLPFVVIDHNPEQFDQIRCDILARRERRGTTSLKQPGCARRRRGFLQGKPHFEGGFRTERPQASSVRVSDSACGVLWQCHNCTRPVASHRLPVSKAGSLPTGQGDQRYWPPR